MPMGIDYEGRRPRIVILDDFPTTPKQDKAAYISELEDGAEVAKEEMRQIWVKMERLNAVRGNKMLRSITRKKIKALNKDLKRWSRFYHDRNARIAELSEA